ncbi:flagellar hook-length control protein FliK [Permianibacter aggregans]|uniref:Flagellar hook-length control protein FliK n=1 Tax=Permianibacter aggregans TaxID=1510150 RepID=A0A4R6US39_9GAMM|nr:flagellar hook-length control protein FliK [Permianibacter aggregans]QGX38273.1 flagellar hook-length control protein FliK [Permianibacter aggregans]TDQ48589.1 flagellar hook-length control protein FliK [Permianibacter aggregans]
MNTALLLMLDTAQLPADGLAMPDAQGMPAGIDFAMLLSQQQMPIASPEKSLKLPSPASEILEIPAAELEKLAASQPLVADGEAAIEPMPETIDEAEPMPLWQVRLPFEMEVKANVSMAATSEQTGGKELPAGVSSTVDPSVSKQAVDSQPSMFANELDANATTTLDNKFNPFQFTAKAAPLAPTDAAEQSQSNSDNSYANVAKIGNKNDVLANGTFAIEQLINEGKQQSSQMAVTPGSAVNIRWRTGQRETEPVSVISATSTTASSSTSTPSADASAIGKPFLPLFSPQFAELLGQQTLSMSQRKIDSAEIRLDPPDMGPMEIKVSQSEGEIKVHFIVQQALTREQVENAINRLREMFDASQLQLADVTVEHRDQQSQQEKTDGGMAKAGNAANGENQMADAGRTTGTLADRLFDAYA